MKLTYRGINYTSNPPIVTLRSTAPIPTTIAKYRGASYSIPQAERTLVLRSMMNLKYRGAYYYPAANLPSDLGLAPT